MHVHSLILSKSYQNISYLSFKDVCLLTVYINTLNANTCTCAFLCSTFNFSYIVTIDFT